MSQGPYSIGGEPWPGLSKLIEEAGETMQVAGKIIGAGGAENHWDGSNLRERMQEELGDLLAAIEFVIVKNELDEKAIDRRKWRKFKLFLEWHSAPVELPAADAEVTSDG